MKKLYKVSYSETEKSPLLHVYIYAENEDQATDFVAINFRSVDGLPVYWWATYYNF